MQLTRFDRWLRVRFVNEIHIYTLREPPELPAHIIAEELPESPGRQFRFRYRSHNTKAADRLIAILKDNSQMFTTRVVDRKAWFVPIIAPDRKSVTWRFIWTVLSIITVVELFYGVKGLLEKPEIQKNLRESLQILKG